MTTKVNDIAVLLDKPVCRVNNRHIANIISFLTPADTNESALVKV